jgi:hypothetical protein
LFRYWPPLPPRPEAKQTIEQPIGTEEESSADGATAAYVTQLLVLEAPNTSAGGGRQSLSGATGK